MAKIKLDLCVILQVSFLLCFVVLIVSGTGSSDSDQSQNPSTEEDSELSLVLQRLVQILGKRQNREQENVIEEMKEQIQSLQSAQENCNSKFESLSNKFDELKKEISEDHGVWMLTPPLRGPPGKKGQTGQKGESGQKGDGGSIGPKGERSQDGLEERPGTNGEPGISVPPSKSITSCSVAMKTVPSPRSKKQTIYPHGNGSRMSLEVLCDFEVDGGGWTIIQKRSSGPKQEFQKTWNEYKNGFGSLDQNFWLGLENIHALTQNGDQELRIELEDFEGNRKYAKYSSFSISDASDFYRLTLAGFSGDAGDTIRSDNGMKFSTIDKDNDGDSSRSCSVVFGSGGWWFGGCSVSALNGLYFAKGETAPQYTGVTWYSWKGYGYSLAKSEMKIRTRK